MVVDIWFDFRYYSDEVQIVGIQPSTLQLFGYLLYIVGTFEAIKKVG